jgi:hypothetical protein
VAAFADQAAAHNLFPVGKMNYAGKDKPIHCAGKQYTFAWLALKKSA